MEDIMPGHVWCTAPSPSEKELEDEVRRPMLSNAKMPKWKIKYSVLHKSTAPSPWEKETEDEAGG